MYPAAVFLCHGLIVNLTIQCVRIYLFFSFKLKKKFDTMNVCVFQDMQTGLDGSHKHGKSKISPHYGVPMRDFD